MLTPAQIRNHQFSVSGRGTYAATEVDDYIKEILVSYEQMFKENGELVNKIGKLANRIEEYKSDEDNIKDVLLTAQRMSDKITKEAKFAAESTVSAAEENAKNTIATAKSEAEKILDDINARTSSMLGEAKEKAEKMVSDAVVEVDKQKLTLEKSKEEIRKFKKDIMSMYEAHIEKLKLIPEEVDESIISSIQAKYASQNQQTNQQNAAQAQEASDEYTQLDDGELDEILGSDDEAEEENEVISDDEYEDEQDEGGFKVSFDEIDEYEEEPAKTSNGSTAAFSSDMGIFGYEDDDDEEDESSAFGSLFKKK